MARPSPCPPELRERVVRMVAEIRPNYPTEWAAMKAVAAKLGIGTAETVHTWVRRAQIDTGQRPGTTMAEAEEIKRLRAENAELRRANEILKERPRLSSAGSRYTGFACTAHLLQAADRRLEGHARHLLRPTGGRRSWIGRRPPATTAPPRPRSPDARQPSTGHLIPRIRQDWTTRLLAALGYRRGHRPGVRHRVGSTPRRPRPVATVTAPPCPQAWSSPWTRAEP